MGQTSSPIFSPHDSVTVPPQTDPRGANSAKNKNPATVALGLNLRNSYDFGTNFVRNAYEIGANWANSYENRANVARVAENVARVACEFNQNLWIRTKFVLGLYEFRTNFQKFKNFSKNPPEFT